MAKIPVALQLSESLIERAQALGLDLAFVLEAELDRLIRADGVAESGAVFEAKDTRRSDELEDSPEAVADYNRRIRENGCFGDIWPS